MDVLPSEQPTPCWVALYELGLLRTASGRVHRLTAYLGWLHDAGFERPSATAWSTKRRPCYSSPATR